MKTATLKFELSADEKNIVVSALDLLLEKITKDRKFLNEHSLVDEPIEMALYNIGVKAIQVRNRLDSRVSRAPRGNRPMIDELARAIVKMRTNLRKA